MRSCFRSLLGFLPSWNFLFIAVCFLALSSCGKYGEPKPPEDFAPAEVSSLAVTPSVQGVTFDWTAPQNDTRGKKLKDLEGYRIYRRELANSALGQASFGTAARLVDPEVKFDLIGTVEDLHLKELMELRAQALEQGQITRRVTLPEERSKFQFIDRSAKPGRRYYYQIVAINQGGVEGKVVERINVLFRGEVSEVARIPYSAEEVAF